MTTTADVPEQPPANTATPTVTPTVVKTTNPATRPLIVIQGYSPQNDIKAGEEFDLTVELKNNSSVPALNIVAVFKGEQIMPLDTGGVRAIPSLGAGKKTNVTQDLVANRDLANAGYTPLIVVVTYNDELGTAYTETFSITLGFKGAVSNGVAAATATPTLAPRAQVVVGAYHLDTDLLQPGTVFNLALEIRNLGNTDAKAVTMVLGGSESSVDMSSGTPEPGGGISGGGSDVTNFAPLESSNLFYVGDIPAGGVVNGSQKLIVNVNTQPGAYPLKLSFVYNDSKNNRQVDDQVITLLVYTLPQIEVGFYRDPGIFFTGQPNAVPLQVTNLGRKTAVLGNMRVTSNGAEIQNNVSLVGALDPGGYFTLDAMAMPMTPGSLEMTITIGYTDDFNQPREITQTVSVNVEEMMMDPGMEGMPPEGMPMEPVMEPETIWQKVLRIVKGLLGLGSGQEQPGPTEMMPGEMPPGEMPPGEQPMPAKPLG